MHKPLTPRLVVAGAARAIDFYVQVFGAREVVRFSDKHLGGRIVHAELVVGTSPLYLTDEERDWHNHAPPSLGGTPVILSYECDDPDALGAAIVAAGGREIFPVADQFYGSREGRFADPFGHVWIVGRTIAAMPDREIQRRIDAGEIA
jgi:PhnB protein